MKINELVIVNWLHILTINSVVKTYAFFSVQNTIVFLFFFFDTVHVC